MPVEHLHVTSTTRQHQGRGQASNAAPESHYPGLGLGSSTERGATSTGCAATCRCSLRSCTAPARGEISTCGATSTFSSSSRICPSVTWIDSTCSTPARPWSSPLPGPLPSGAISSPGGTRSRWKRLVVASGCTAVPANGSTAVRRGPARRDTISGPPGGSAPRRQPHLGQSSALRLRISGVGEQELRPDSPLGEHEPDAAQRVEVGQRVTVDHEQVRAEAGRAPR